jgi:hypothetical protein
MAAGNVLFDFVADVRMLQALDNVEVARDHPEAPPAAWLDLRDRLPSVADASIEALPVPPRGVTPELGRREIHR